MQRRALRCIATVRLYSPGLGRFIQADTVVPGAGNPQALNRYAYVSGNPLRYTDPSGHWIDTALDIAGIAWDIHGIHKNGLNWSTGLALAVDVVCAVMPLATGGGALVRAASHADEAVDVVDTTRVVERVDDVADVTRGIANAADEARKEAIEEAISQTDGVLRIAGDDPGTPTWPQTPREMDEFLSLKGKRIPDTPSTPGRNKIVWEPSDNIRITYDQHPYHPNAPEWHRGPHWHLDMPGKRHLRYLPGDLMPGYQ